MWASQKGNFQKPFWTWCSTVHQKGPMTHPGRARKSFPLLCPHVAASIPELLIRPPLALIGSSTQEYKAESKSWRAEASLKIWRTRARAETKWFGKISPDFGHWLMKEQLWLLPYSNRSWQAQGLPMPNQHAFAWPTFCHFKLSPAGTAWA